VSVNQPGSSYDELSLKTHDCDVVEPLPAQALGWELRIVAGSFIVLRLLGNIV